MCKCDDNKCPCCGAPVKKCKKCGDVEYDEPTPRYPYYYPYYYPYSNPPTWIPSPFYYGTGYVGPYTMTVTCNGTEYK